MEDSSRPKTAVDPRQQALEHFGLEAKRSQTKANFSSPYSDLTSGGLMVGNAARSLRSRQKNRPNTSHGRPSTFEVMKI